MKVLLIFPPQWVPFRPHLGLPSIAAYLKEHGVDVELRDLNIETYDMMLSPTYFSKLRQRLDNRFAILDSGDQLTSRVQQQYYNDLFIAKSSARFIAQELDGAKRLLRGGNGFYDVEALLRAKHTLERALAVISIAYFPTMIGLESLETPSFDKTIEGLQTITLDKDQNPFLEIFKTKMVPEIVKGRPDVIGISITGYSQIIPALTLARLIKKISPTIHVVFGGNIVTLFADSIKKNRELFSEYLDSAILYEGEKPMLSLVEHLEAHLPLDTVPNLIYLGEEGVNATGTCAPAEINSLPTPDFDGLPLELYFSPEPVLPVLASRGCYWSKCAFCSQNCGFGDSYHNREVHRIVDDLRRLSERYGAKQFAFADEALSPSQIGRLADEIVKAGLKVDCSTNIRMERQFTPDLCKRVADAGFRLLYLGLESGSDLVLNLMNKGITTEMARLVCRNVYEAGIWNHLYVMFGFPGETNKEAGQTIDFLLENKKVIHSFHTDNFSLERGMEVERNPEKFGVKIEKLNFQDFSITYDFKVTGGLTYQQACELSLKTMDEVGSQFEGNKILNVLTHYFLIHYLAHFKDTDPSLKNLLPTNPKLDPPHKQITPDTVPHVKQSVVIQNLAFDLPNLRHILASERAVELNRRPTTILFDPESNIISTIPPEAVEILALVNGRRTIKIIAANLADRYDAPAYQIEKDILPLLNSLFRSGYLRT